MRKAHVGGAFAAYNFCCQVSGGRGWLKSALSLRPENSGPGAVCLASGSYEDKPSRSCCRIHSAGRSRRVATPMPRGSRPSTAACTSVGVRKASVIVRFICLMLHFSRSAICSTFMTASGFRFSAHTSVTSGTHWLNATGRVDPKNVIGHSNRGDAFRVKGEYGPTITDLGAIRRNQKIADDVRGFALQELAT